MAGPGATLLVVVVREKASWPLPWAKRIFWASCWVTATVSSVAGSCSVFAGAPSAPVAPGLLAALAAALEVAPTPVTRTVEGPDAPGWSPEDATLLRAVDDLLSSARVADATWEELAATLDRQQLMDLVFTVGAYDVVAMAFLSFGVEVDDDLAAWRERPGGNAILPFRET